VSSRAATIRNLTLLCSVWFLLGSGNAIGQDQSQVDTPPAGVTPDETTPNGTTPDGVAPIEVVEPEAVNELIVDEEAIDNNSVESPESEMTESTGRFIPTEQISQDLGVSFPANI
jgi:hypothetical protein